MKTICLLLAITLCGSVAAQRSTVTKAKPGDTTFPKTSTDGMPNAITAPPTATYKGNNGKGFNVYRSSVDNMPVLMPDSANRASLYKDESYRKQKSVTPLQRKIPQVQIIRPKNPAN